MNSKSAQELQHEYYQRTAHSYRHAHEEHGSAHDTALEHVAALLPHLHAESVLDVGAGTGRAVRFFLERMPNLHVRGIEPVEELIAEAEARGVPPTIISQGDGTALPFADGAFDVVTTFGVLHHVQNPTAVISELLRVARKAVCISDSNRFAQGRPLARYAKLAIHAAGLWRAFDLLRTRGRGYFILEGDGLIYSYSVFDSLKQLRASARKLTLIELDSAPVMAGTWGGPLCNAPHLLVVAVKDQT